MLSHLLNRDTKVTFFFFVQDEIFILLTHMNEWHQEQKMSVFFFTRSAERHLIKLKHRKY